MDGSQDVWTKGIFHACKIFTNSNCSFVRTILLLRNNRTIYSENTFQAWLFTILLLKLTAIISLGLTLKNTLFTSVQRKPYFFQ